MILFRVEMILKMIVFLSWSGVLSLDLAHALHVEQPTVATELLNPVLCEDMNMTECKLLDLHMIDAARKLTKAALEHDFIRILVLPIRFADHEHRLLPTRDQIVSLFEGQDGVLDFLNNVSPQGVSFGAHVANWTTTDNTEIHYSFGNWGLTRSFREAIWPVLDTLAMGPDLDFGQFDVDNNQELDMLLVLHSSFPGNFHVDDCHGIPSRFRIAGHALHDTRAIWENPSVTSYKAFSYAAIPALAVPHPVHCHRQLTSLSVVLHYVFRLFGLPDLEGQLWESQNGVGSFDMMGYPDGFGEPKVTGYLSAWSRVKLGWSNPMHVERTGVYSLGTAIQSNQVLSISNGFPEGECFLIEYRQRERWDDNLYDTGVLVWHVIQSKTEYRPKSIKLENQHQKSSKSSTALDGTSVSVFWNDADEELHLYSSHKSEIDASVVILRRFKIHPDQKTVSFDLVVPSRNDDNAMYPSPVPSYSTPPVAATPTLVEGSASLPTRPVSRSSSPSRLRLIRSVPSGFPSISQEPSGYPSDFPSSSLRPIAITN